tara:strand:+ start:42226 stop:43005 length:780 start_codon:yes stop_codon:yes gene_type:complete
MAIDIITGFKSSSREALDARSGPYETVTEANTALGTFDRYVGLPVTIVTGASKDGSGNYTGGTPSTYTYEGGIADINLIAYGGGIGDMAKSIYDPSNKGYVNKAGKIHLIVDSLTSNGAIDLDLDTFTNFDLLLDGNVSSFSISNGELYQRRIVNISKNAAGYYFDIADDYSDAATYSTGDVRGVESEGSVLGRIYYKANQDIIAPEVFNPAKWDLHIKMQDDVEVSLSYAQDEKDQLIITPKITGSIMYYSITPNYNV